MLVAVQNAAEPRDIGSATSAVNFFRSMGGSFGAAVLWSVLIIALNRELAAAGGALPENGFALLQGGPESLARLTPELRAAILPALATAFHAVFAAAAVLSLLGLIISAALRELPLRTTAHATAPAARLEHVSAE
jgi:hypothetical protein